ncbi:MAG: 4Fe-4S dicluster domain-containing protein [Deltaproteobacteria bacterium]|nr:4Fe-4S dicluster domain-containing protein [Deltaproteobacteria bacterium]
MKNYRFLSARNFKRLVIGLLKDFKVIGAVKKDGFPAYANISRFEELTLFQTPAHLSAKEFLFPQRETLLRFNIQEETHEGVIEAEDQVLIGLHPCDIHGMNLMDRVFAGGTPDANYLARRRKTVVIGADCFPDDYCFCKSLGTDAAEEGFDLFLHEVRGGFLVRTGTDNGGKLLSKHASTRSARAADVKDMEKRRKKRDASFTARIDALPSRLPEIYSKSGASPVWERIGSICYGCGSCNNVCPTCYCFDVRDEVKTNLKEGSRVRVWDGCTLDDFAKVAGGHDFRRTRAVRLRHRFNRKFNYLTDRFGALFCTGCGRCSRACLVKINITEVTNELIREYNAR